MHQLHNGELHNLYSSPNIIRQVKSKGMKSAGRVARMEKTEKCTRFWWERMKERDHSQDRGVDGSIGSKWIFGDWLGGCGVDSPGSGEESVAGCCECGDEPSGSGATELVRPHDSIRFQHSKVEDLNTVRKQTPHSC
jgi:hypothetical protein